MGLGRETCEGSPHRTKKEKRAMTKKQCFAVDGNKNADELAMVGVDADNGRASGRVQSLGR